MSKLGGIVQNLGDAISGFDREGAYMEGMVERSELDNRKAATEASFALARQRQQQAQNDAYQQQLLEAISQMDQQGLAANPGQIVAAGRGNDYAGAQLGMNRNQEYGARERLMQPGLTPQEQFGTAGALAPSAMVGELGDVLYPSEPELGPMDIYLNDEGLPTYGTREDIRGRQPAARPSATGSGGNRTANQNNIDDLVARGWDPEVAASMVYNTDADPRTTHSQIFRQVLGNIMFDEEDAWRMANEYVETVYGPDWQNATGVRAGRQPPDLGASFDVAQGESFVPDSAALPQMTGDDAADQALYDSLPSGEMFVDPAGNTRRKP